MTDQQNTFEIRLASLFDRYAAAAPVEVDASALASAIAARDARVIEVFGRAFVKPRWLVPVLLGLLLLVAFTVALFVGARLLQTPVKPYDRVFTAAGELAGPRQGAMALQLADGRILVSGGQDGSPEGASAEVFDLTMGSSGPVSGVPPLGSGINTILPDGRAFAIAFSMNMTSSWAYLFDPSTNEYERIPINTFSNAPVYGVEPAMALLDDGRVLIAGGKGDVYKRPARREAVIFDPTTDSFIPTGSLNEPRMDHSMVTLRDGRVLVAGGMTSSDRQAIGQSAAPFANLAVAELYDPASGEFVLTGEMHDIAGRTLSVLMGDGRVAVFQRVEVELANPDPAGPFAVEIYDPATGIFGDGGTVARSPKTATALRDGRVLLTGTSLHAMTYVGPGEYWDRYEPWAMVYDPATGAAEGVTPPRAQDSGVTVLDDGRVMFAGGLAYPLADENGNGTGEPFSVPWVEIFE